MRLVVNRKSNPLITDVQNYWDTRPCNVRHSPKQVGTKEYFDEVERRKYFVEPHIPKFANFDYWSDKKVLEMADVLYFTDPDNHPAQKLEEEKK